MGLFSRNKAKSPRPAAHRPRPSVSSEAQAASLRVRARRRLAGAVALVLAAVVILPMLLDGEPRPVPAGIEIAVPERNAPFNPDLSAPPVAEALQTPSATDQGTSAEGLANGQVSDVGVPTTDLTGQGGQPTGTTTPATTPVAAPKPEASSATKPETKPQSQTKPTPEAVAPAAPAAAKTDQTAEALAILEGRASPPATNAANASTAQSGAYVLQVASYGSDADANARVDQLKSQGISNAFVESATVNGKPTFRLRVGPFDSRTAAQAAQARLRTLGYDNGFITTK